MSQPAGYRVWALPDGSVQVYTHLNPDLDVQARSNAKMAERLPGATFVDVATTDALRAILPADRSQRGKWRMQGGRVVVDPTVPDPPDPAAARRAAINAATTLAELKAVLLADG